MSNLVHVGDRVETKADGLRGTVRYLGAVKRASGTWAGIELDEAVPEGSDGVHDGTPYFSCRAGHGTLLPLESVIALHASADDYFGPVSSTNASGVPSSSSFAHASHSEDFFTFEEVSRVLERRMSARPSTVELETYGVVPPNYFTDPNKAIHAVEMGHELVAYNLDDFLQRRPSQDQLERMGVVPQRYFEDPDAAERSRQIAREMVSFEMNDFLPRRKSRMELADQNIIPREFVMNEAPIAEEMRQEQRREVEQELEQRLDKSRRPSIVDVANMDIIPTEYIDDILFDAVTQHSRKESRMDHVKDRLVNQNFPDAVAGAVAENLIDFVAETEREQQEMMRLMKEEEERRAQQASQASPQEEAQTRREQNKSREERPVNAIGVGMGGRRDEERVSGANAQTQQEAGAVVLRNGGVPMPMPGQAIHVVQMIDPSNDMAITFFVDPFQGFVPMAPVKRANTQGKLERRLSRDMRPTTRQLETWGVVPPNYFEDPDVDHVIQEQKAHRRRVSQSLETKLNPHSRPSIRELGERNIIPEDWLYDLYGLADDVRKRHNRMESAVADLSGRLNVPPVLADVVARDVLNEIESIQPTLDHGDGPVGPVIVEEGTREEAQRQFGARGSIGDEERVTPGGPLSGAEMEAQLVRFQHMINDLTQQLSESLHRNGELESKVGTLVEQNEDLGIRVKQLEAKEKDYMSRISEAHHQLELTRQADSGRGVLEAQISDLQKENADLHRRMDESTRSQLENQRSIDQLEKDVKRWQSAKQTVSEERDEVYGQYREAMQRNRELDSELRRVEQSKTQLLLSLNDQMDQFRSYLRNMNAHRRSKENGRV